ncbi:MAG: DUF4026 domain-containing protein [Roseburia sp.]
MDRTSCMLAIPANERELAVPELLVERILAMDNLVALSVEKEDEIVMEVMYSGELYRIRFFPTDLEVPPMYRAQHFFPDLDIEAIEQRDAALMVLLDFTDAALESFHFQLKLIDAMFAGVLAVLDVSAEKILSGKWVALAAASHVSPAPRYLYTVQAVGGEDGRVWLHTHGLNRCNVTELEILNSDQENYQEHFHVIEGMASRLLELDEPLSEKEPLFLAQLGEIPLMAALLSWEKAIRFYDEDLLGGSADREDGHNHDTSCIFTYLSEEDYEKGILSLVSVYNDILGQNPVYMLSIRETERMKALAMERISYVKHFVGQDGVSIHVKLGLPIDEEYKSDGNEKEHIWFELLAISDLMLRAKMAHEPYYISSLHEGDIREYPICMLTDWVIFLPEYRVTPDDVYLLELEKGGHQSKEC